MLISIAEYLRKSICEFGLFYSDSTTYGKTPTKPIYKVIDKSVFFQRGRKAAPKGRDSMHVYRPWPIDDEQQPLMSVFVAQYCS